MCEWSSDVCSSDLLELESARARKPLGLGRREELYGRSGERQQLRRNARSGRIGLLVPARSLLADDGTRVARFELVRPLKHGHLTAEQLEESNWEPVEIGRAACRERVCQYV